MTCSKMTKLNSLSSKDAQPTNPETVTPRTVRFSICRLGISLGSSEKLVSPTARLMRGWLPLTVNPDGIASSSPGLRGTSYPGKSCKPRLNPNGAVAALDTLGHNSDGVGSHWRGVPRVARKLAILGFVAQSLGIVAPSVSNLEGKRPQRRPC